MESGAYLETVFHRKSNCDLRNKVLALSKGSIHSIVINPTHRDLPGALQQRFLRREQIGAHQGI